MYSNIKTRRQGGLARRFSGNNSRRGSFSRGKSSANISLYVNKAVDAPVQETFVAKHRFSDFNLHPIIQEQVKRHGYITPTPIQDRAIPEIMAGRDVIGMADTGTGKTAAFLLPLLNKIANDRREKVLIIAPTRELAVQIDDELKLFAQGMQIFSALCIGGVGINNQTRALARRPNFIIGTPGRLKDHFNRHSLRLNDVTNLVVDEADHAVEMGFIKDVRFLISQLPQNRQSLFFSATIAGEVKGLIASFTRDPQTISVKNRDTSLNVDQDVIRYTDPFHRMSLLHQLLMREEFKKVLIFGRTKHGVEKLHLALVDRGISSVSIHGNKNQAQRQRSLNEFKQSHTQVMVATDVAARGLDIPDVSHVINFEPPESYTDYIHRIGRTGRADKKGVALTFIN